MIHTAKQQGHKTAQSPSFGLVLLAALGGFLFATAADAAEYDFPNFTNAGSLTINSNANIATENELISGPLAPQIDVLQLVPASANEVGTCFLTSQVHVATFSTFFTFRMNDTGGTADPNSHVGGDGLMFVLQTVSNTAVGALGEYLGFAGIAPSVGVAFDTYQDTDENDPSSNFIGIHTNGNVNNGTGASNTLNVATPFDDGNLWNVWVDYDGTNLQVRANESGVRGATADLSRPMNVVGTLGASNAFIGCTAATAASYQKTEVWSLYYRDTYAPFLAPIITGFSGGGTIQDGATNLVLSVTAAGAGPLSYQWSHNNTNLSDGAQFTGSRSNVLTIANILASEAGTYQVVVSNSAGTVSTNLVLTVTCSPVQVTSVAGSVQAQGPNKSFGIQVTGNGPISYTWSRNGTNLTDNSRVTGSQSAELQFATLLPGDAGTYQVTVSNCGGLVTTNLSLTTQPAVLSNTQVILAGDTGFDGCDIVVATNADATINGSHIFNSLGVVSNGILTFAGGTTQTVTGTIMVTGDSTLVCQGANTTAMVSNQWAGVGVTIIAANVTVQAGSEISADGQGYTGGNGPGAGSGSYGAGGGYGGSGGNFNGAGGGTYGSATFPTDLGSAGSLVYSQGGTPGAGGGAIELSVSQTLILNGTITANGISYGPGAGSGGSVLLLVNTLTGSGSLAANGGASGEGPGGGGRIAAYFTNTSSTTSFTGFTNCAANGYNPGTAVFFDASVTRLGLDLFESMNFGQSVTNHYGAVTLYNGALLTLGGGSLFQVDGALTLQSNSTIICQGINTSGQISNQWVGKGMTIQAGNVTIAAGATISADGQGYVAGNGPGAGSGGYGAGGGYGGSGGNFNGAGGGTYGSATFPTDLGSASAQTYLGGGAPGVGGGAIELSVSQTLTLNGTITANGISYGPGGGSGGSVLLLVNTLTGSGSLAANGGFSNPGEGGGGRIAAYFTNSSSTSSFTGFSNCAANGFNPGTVVFFDASVTRLGLDLYEDLVLGQDVTNHYGAVTLNNGATLTLGGGSVLQVDGALTLQSNSTIICLGINTSGQVSNQWVGQGVTIQASNVTIAAGATISADGQGYLNGNGPGAGSGGYGAGGGYGGDGGTFNGAGGGTYGSATLPTDLGSSSAQDYLGGGTPGAGGGAIELSVSQTLTLNGTITANGISYGPGGGSGGSVLLLVNTLTGSGSLAANGGATSGGPGGGGRIALYVSQALTYPTNSVLANSGGSAAQAGSVVIVIKRPNLQWMPQANGGTFLTWGVFPVYTYQTQYSSNLLNWANLGSTVSPTNYTFLTVSNITGLGPELFYRVVVLP